MDFFEHLIARNRRRSQETEALRQKIRNSLQPLVDTLVKEFGVQKVILFGSLVQGPMSDHPDIDLLVEGLHPDKYPKALGRLFQIAPLPVDLVPIETGRSEIVRVGLEQGEVLYAA